MGGAVGDERIIIDYFVRFFFFIPFQNVKMYKFHLTLSSPQFIMPDRERQIKGNKRKLCYYQVYERDRGGDRRKANEMR